ncbi:MAG: hypothetical protein J6Q58_04500 [Clostridia bacterium]|nr:hypothetical protein [Clostridia bacterium]
MKSCSFIGHRNTKETPKLLAELKKIVIRLITEENVKIFLFGSKSKFDDLCHSVLVDLQEKYCDIKLIYVRSHFPYINESYKDYLLQYYDDTIMPTKVINAGKASYVERNQEIIDASDFCIFYYNLKYKPKLRKQSKTSIIYYQPNSGTKLAYEYAKQKKKPIINLYKENFEI